MSLAFKLVSLAALALVTIPSLLYFMNSTSHDTVKMTALVGTIVWFATTPFWMGRELSVDADKVEI